jgi:translation initiation factor 2 subunit 2
MHIFGLGNIYSSFSPRSLPASSGTGDDEEDSYDDMLARVYTQLFANNSELVERTRKKLPPPQVMRVGSTRTAWVNFKESCVSMKRSLEHVQSFFLAELGTTGSIDGSERFLMRGKYLPKYIENLLRKYITVSLSCV